MEVKMKLQEGTFKSTTGEDRGRVIDYIIGTASIGGANVKFGIKKGDRPLFDYLTKDMLIPGTDSKRAEPVEVTGKLCRQVFEIEGRVFKSYVLLAAINGGVVRFVASKSYKSLLDYLLRDVEVEELVEEKDEEESEADGEE